MKIRKQRSIRHPDDGLLAPRRAMGDEAPVDGQTRRFFDIRAALRGFVSAPFRIHRYRDVHTRMLRDALCSMDCGTGGSGKKLQDQQ